MSTVGIITQNVASESVSPDEAFTPPNQPDILVICRQEVRDPDTASIVPDTFLKIYPFTHEISLNKSSTKSKQNVKIAIYGKNRAWDTVQSGTIPVSAKAGIMGTFGNIYQSIRGYSKGAVWIQINKDASSFLFVNLHLPMDKKAPGLGYDYRKRAFYVILKKLKQMITPNTYLFVAGDLNFRINENNQDQLDRLLKFEFPPIPLIDVSDLSNIPKQYTCKFKAIDNRVCRFQSVRPGYPAKDPRCFVEDRIPSRCDRILVGQQHLPLREYTTFALGSSCKFDHNGVYVVFNQPIPSRRRSFERPPLPLYKRKTRKYAINRQRRSTRKH